MAATGRITIPARAPVGHEGAELGGGYARNQEEDGCDDVVPVSAEPSKPYIKVSRCLTGLVPQSRHRPFTESCFLVRGF